MKIIKNGNKNLLSVTKRFKCEKCGCIFEANKNEYKAGTQYNDTYYHCKCPQCDNDTSQVMAMR